jgi:hypothetical protein
MVLLFGEQLTEDNTSPATRETILRLMVSRKWISEHRAYELELMSEDDIKSRTKEI